MKKYTPSTMINRGMYAGMYEPDPSIDIIEAESASAALSIYLEEIADNLNVVDAKRIDDGRYDGEAEFQYYDSDEELTTLTIRVEEVESDQ